MERAIKGDTHTSAPVINERVALVTGSSSGIGFQLVLKLIASGYAVIATCRSSPHDLQQRLQRHSDLQERLQQRASHSPRGRLLGAVQLDVDKDESVDSALDCVRTQLGVNMLHLVINNAGAVNTKKPRESALDIDPDDMHRMFQTNVIGALRVMRAFYPLLKESTKAEQARSCPSMSKVINISSIMGSIALYQETNGMPLAASYRISKNALNMLTRCVAMEYSKDMISVAIHPGWVQTPMGRNWGGEPPLTPAESAQKIVDLIGSASEADNGKFLGIDGQQLPW